MIIPKITFIIPVYNVEQYLRQCLDSVVNQTLQEIQIICVNDGSPDNSRSILQEYADKDPRIQIIDKPNGGLSSARNAAYLHIRGKYTLFIDSDDWIELDLCEKTYKQAEMSDAVMTVFFYQKGQDGARPMYQISPCDKITVEEKLSLLEFPSAWSKLWRSDFLFENKLYFPEGLVFEDTLVHWQAVTLADKISIVPERLYHYRCNVDSISRTTGKHTLHIVSIYNKIYEYLLESGYYATYRDMFISKKLHDWYHFYLRVPASLKSQFAAMIRESLTADDRDFYCTDKNTLSKTARLFYKMVDGDLRAVMYYPVLQAADDIVKLPERLLRHWVIKPIKKRLKGA